MIPNIHARRDGREEPKEARVSEKALRPVIETAGDVIQDIARSGTGVQEPPAILNPAAPARGARESDPMKRTRISAPDLI